MTCPQGERCELREGRAQCVADWYEPEEVSAGEMSAGGMSAGEMSAGEMSVGEMSAGEMSAGEGIESQQKGGDGCQLKSVSASPLLIFLILSIISFRRRVDLTRH